MTELEILKKMSNLAWAYKFLQSSPQLGKARVVLRIPSHIPECTLIHV